MNNSTSVQESTSSLNKNFLSNSTPNSSYLSSSDIKKEPVSTDSSLNSGNTLKKIKIKKKKLNSKSNTNEYYAGSQPSTTSRVINEKQIINFIEAKEESLKNNSKEKEANSHKDLKVIEVLFN